MFCSIHNTAMFQGKYGPVHKVENDPNLPKGWCNGPRPESPQQAKNSQWLEPTKAPTRLEPAEKVDWDAKERRIVRMNVLNRTTDLIIAGQIDIKDLDKTVDRLEEIIYTFRKSAQTNDSESES